jgi:thiosulfate/3-mercaptopyruvate sulfurtransferase
MYTLLIQASELQKLIPAGQVRVFDCSFDLMQPQAGAQQFATAHIPGASYVNLDQHLSDKASAPSHTDSGGRHPLPNRKNFARWAGEQGVMPGTQVVVYDRQGANYCGRLWWMLRWLGHEAVAVLDGGMQAWQQEGGSVEAGPGKQPQAAAPYPDLAPLEQLVDAKAVQSLIGKPNARVLDARSGPRFRGEVEPLDPVAGHIPGAINRPFSENMGTDGRFKSPEQLRQELSRLLGPQDPVTSTPREVVHHCGSGVSAVPNLIAQRLAGLGQGTLYAGSWSDWCSNPQLPVAKG